MTPPTIPDKYPAQTEATLGCVAPLLAMTEVVDTHKQPTHNPGHRTGSGGS